MTVNSLVPVLTHLGIFLSEIVGNRGAKYMIYYA